jgi:HSP20 family molecular chaperone IbpA
MTVHDDALEAREVAEATMAPQPVPVNVYEASEAMVVVAVMPAVTAEDVQVELRPGSLRFWSHLRSATTREYLLHEWSYGGYEREVPVPSGYGAGLDATLANGQLVVRVLRGSASGETRSMHPHAM